jgi:hypothetical protein
LIFNKKKKKKKNIIDNETRLGVGWGEEGSDGDFF